MSSPANAIRDILVANSIGTVGQEIHMGEKPTSPPNLIVITDVVTMEEPDPKYALDYPKVQVLVRNLDRTAGWNKALEIKNLILGRDSEEINGVYYTGFFIKNDIAFIGKDDNRRSEYTITFRLITEPNNTGNRISVR